MDSWATVDAWDAVAAEGVSLDVDPCWQTVTYAFDPAAPVPLDVRASDEVRAALAALRTCDAELAAWFLESCSVACVRFLRDALRLVETEDACALQAALPGALRAIARWVTSRKALMGADAGGLHLAHRTPTFMRQCRAQFVAAMRPPMLDGLFEYFGRAFRMEDASIRVDEESVQVYAELRVLGLDALMHGVLMHIATDILEQAAAHATGAAATTAPSAPRLHLHDSAFDALMAMLRTQLLPAIAVMRAAGSDMADVDMPPAPEEWDASMALPSDGTPAPDGDDTDGASLGVRLEYSLCEALGRRRLTQLFDIVASYPESRPALRDLLVWLEKANQRAEVVRVFDSALHRRLLHPGVDTHAILVFYVRIVYALRVIDTSGVVLSQVLPPVQRYLRTRRDTIDAVVLALLGDDAAFELLRGELQVGAGADARAAPAVPASGSDAVGRAWHADAAPSAPPPAASAPHRPDTTWMPRPVDAGPEYSEMRSRDVIDLLVSIFDDHEGFITALEKHTAQQLVRTVGFDTARVRRNNDIFKRRFGESSLHHCDVMLGDIAASQTLAHAFHAHGPRLDAQRQPADALEPSSLAPIVISRQFWPDLDVGTLTMPRRLAHALDAYRAYYAAAHPNKRISWLPLVGSVDVDIEMLDGRSIRARVSPLQASVAELVAGLGVATDDPRPERVVVPPDDPVHPKTRVVTADNVAAALAIDRQAAVGALRFWVGNGVLGELPAPATGTFEVLEYAEGPGGDSGSE
ncbi:hypothetical protein MSPP1_002103 [Malassezia sp. CBS 17886]|nr:hypothetical protein MSPP1_002103 [Malassezia sp. CBS 17886]